MAEQGPKEYHHPSQPGTKQHGCKHINESYGSISLGDLSDSWRGSDYKRRRQTHLDDSGNVPSSSDPDEPRTSTVSQDDNSVSVKTVKDNLVSPTSPNDGIFENTILDPKVYIASFSAKGPDEILHSASIANKPCGKGLELSLIKGGGQLVSAEKVNDWRTISVSTTPKETLVPYADVLKRIRTNYKLKELSEEDYVGCLETIIERDYFPDLMKLRIKTMIMEAENAGDANRALYLKKKLENLDKENEEMRIKLRTAANEDISVNIGKGGLKLDEFSRIFTSEDNRSFGRLMEQSIIRSNEINSWMEDGERKHNLALAATQAKTNLGINDREVQSNRASSRNSLFFNDTSTSSESNKNQAPIIRSANTYMPSNHEDRMAELEHRQKVRRTENVKDAYHGKVNDLITQFGLRECKELLDEEQLAKYDFVQTPLTSLSTEREYSVPKPIAREELAEKLRKKYQSTPAGTPMPNTPSCKTPLLVQKLIAKHNSMSDLQLRSSYSSSKYSKGSVRSGVIFKS
ncbi:DGCR14, putative [Babesia ovis]|uniref:DGCR14, putative n=1 Tax=Babesia ovis TaxID=5869 RepID=A0A9W5TCZ0_BABOV|nr:DGCR14, putative [Babesia ovis]